MPNKTPSTRASKLRRWLKRGLAVFLGVLILALSSAGVFVSTERGRIWLVSTIVNRISTEQLSVELEGLRSQSLSHWSADSVAVFRRQELFLQATDIELVWAPLSLLDKLIEVHRLTLQTLTLHKLNTAPEAQPEAQENAEAPQLPQLSLHFIKIFSFSTVGFELPVVGDPPPSLALTAALNSEQNLQFQFTAVSDNSHPTRLAIEGDFVSLNEGTLSGSIEEDASGILGEYLKLPEQQPLSVQFTMAMVNTGEVTQYRILEATIPISQHRYQLNATVTRTRQGYVRIDNAVVSVDDSTRHYISGSVNAGALDIDVELDEFPLDIARPWLDTPKIENFTDGTISTDLNISGAIDTPQIYGDIAIDTRFNNKPLDIDIVGKTDLTTLTLQQAHLISGNTKVHAQGTADIRKQDSSLQFTVENLESELLSSFGVTLPDNFRATVDNASGTIKGNITDPNVEASFSGSAKYQNLEAQVVGDIRKQDKTITINNGTVDTDTGSANIRGAIDIGGVAPSIDMRIVLQDISHTVLPALGVSPVEALNARANGRIKVKGKIAQPRIDYDVNVGGDYKAMPFYIASVGHVFERNIAIEEASLHSEDTLIAEVSGSLDPTSIDFNLRVYDTPASLARTFGLRENAELTANLDVSGSTSRPSFNGSLEYSASLPTQSKDANAQLTRYRLSANITTSETTTQITTVFTQNDGSLGEFTIRSPIGPLVGAMLGDAAIEKVPLDTRIVGDFDLAGLSFIMDPEIYRFAGEVSSNIEIDGTFNSPTVNGIARVKDARYHDMLNDITIDRINCVVNANPRELTLEPCSAHDGHTGKFDMTGVVHFPQGDEPGNINVELRANSVNIIKTPSVDGEVSGNLAATGDFEAIKVEGLVEIAPLNVVLESTADADIPTITVEEVYYRESEDADSDNSAARRLWPKTYLDIGLVVKERAFLRGRGIEAELKGKLQLTGTAEQLNYQGELETVRGVFEVFGKKFTLISGDVTFVNNQFALSFEGQYRKGGQEIRAQLTGTNEKLNLQLSATPSMPEDQILAFIMFGESAQNITPFEALQLAAALQKLRGGGGGFDPISKARDILEVDSISVDSEEDEAGERNFNLEIGKYLNEDVYLELQGSDNDSQPWKGKLEIQLTPRLILESSTGGKTGIEGAQLKWQRNY